MHLGCGARYCGLLDDPQGLPAATVVTVPRGPESMGAGTQERGSNSARKVVAPRLLDVSALVLSQPIVPLLKSSALDGK